MAALRGLYLNCAVCWEFLNERRMQSACTAHLVCRSFPMVQAVEGCKMKRSTPQKVESSAPDSRSFSRKSTAIEAQYERLLEKLRLRDHHTMELRRVGIMMPAARVKELNDRYGYSIETVDRVTLVDEWGFSHPRVAFYSLRFEPEVHHACSASVLEASHG
jgi:hypothetical protein